MQGTIKAVNERGFGFITPDGGGPDVFFHFRSLSAGVDEGQLTEHITRVSFETKRGDKGPMAVRIQLLEQAPPTDEGPGIEECLEGLRQAELALVEWTELLEHALKQGRA